MSEQEPSLDAFPPITTRGLTGASALVNLGKNLEGKLKADLLYSWPCRLPAHCAALFLGSHATGPAKEKSLLVLLVRNGQWPNKLQSSLGRMHQRKGDRSPAQLSHFFLLAM